MIDQSAISPAVETLLARAQNIPPVDIPEQVRDEAGRLKADVKRALGGRLTEAEEGALHDLRAALEVLHRGRVPLLGMGSSIGFTYDGE